MGDSILSLAVTIQIDDAYPNLSVGQRTVSPVVGTGIPIMDYSYYHLS